MTINYYLQFTEKLSLIITILPKIVIWLIVIFTIYLLLLVARWIYNQIRLLKQKVMYLELTPPAWDDQTPEATNQLFIALYGLGMTRHWYEKILGHHETYSLEIVSTRQEGIRFILRVAADKTDALRQSVTTYVPNVKVKVLEDYLAPKAIPKTARIFRFKQQRHFAYPLQNYNELIKHDPVGYLTAAMTKLENNELMSFQLVISPMHIRGVNKLRDKILRNDDLTDNLGNQPTVNPNISAHINNALFGLTDIVSTTYHGDSKTNLQSAQKDLDYQKQIAQRLKPMRTLSYFEQELVASIHMKLAQTLFKTEIRVLLVCSSKKETKKRRQAIISAISLFNIPKYQSLKPSSIWNKLSQKYQKYMFIRRLPSQGKNTNILSASELSGLYHFPHSQTAKTENVVKSLSRTMPAPISLKNDSKLDILLGKNVHHGSETPIGLTADERERHIYIIGGTGNGKTTMLQYAIIQDIQKGKGVAVIDPHGDMAETILRHIPEERIKDVIYFNPDDLSYPIGINLLELPPNISGDDLLREKDLITESTISVLRKIFSEDDSGGHRIEYVLRNTIQTALTIEDATLFTIFRLLNDGKYRREIIRNLEDEDLKNFWVNEMGKAGDFQRVKMSAGITAKIGRFLFSASAKQILEQEKSTINFDEILDSGKILIANLSKGLLGEDTSALFGTMLLAKLQIAALRRARIKQTDRKPFYIYVDEFQNFATMSFVQMLSEARKYKLFLTMAEQSTSQQDQQRLVDIILANVGTVICFRSGSPADERYVLPLFSPYIDQGEIANLPAYNFYTRIAAIQAQEPVSGMTVLLRSTGSETMAKNAIDQSRKTYGTSTILESYEVQKIAKPIIHKKASIKLKSTVKTKTAKVPVV